MALEFPVTNSRVRENFFYYNNGLTILCNKIKVPPNVNRVTITLEGMQVVNGGQTLRCLNELKKEGLVRYIGASNASPADVIDYVNGGEIDFIQNRYSIIHRLPTDDITDLCIKNNIKMNPYQIIERGQLIDTAPNAGEWREGDLRAKKSEYVGDVYDRVHTWVVDALSIIAREAGITLEELSIRWTFSNPQVTLPVIGATKIWQVKNNMKVSTTPLSSDILNEINDAYNSFALEIQNVFGLSVEEFRGLV